MPPKKRFEQKPCDVDAALAYWAAKRAGTVMAYALARRRSSLKAAETRYWRAWVKHDNSP
jgi:hypothetical protein